MNIASGFKEIEHTADWELEAWAPDLPSLLEQAARGMYALSDTRLEPGPRQPHSLEIQARDAEGLLVSLLSELLFLAESEGLGFDSFQFSLDGLRLKARLAGAPIASFDKEIKAVTYHRLKIRETENGLLVNVVFDV
jgi:SHS2 domain-containing protein